MLLVLAGLVLMACGGGSDDPETPVAQAEQAQAEQAQVEQTEAEPAEEQAEEEAAAVVEDEAPAPAREDEEEAEEGEEAAAPPVQRPAPAAPPAPPAPVLTAVNGVVAEDGLALVGADGTAVEIPAGALTAGTSLELGPASPPALPEGVTPLGVAVEITTEEVLGQPTTVRLPVPAGADPEGALIYRVSDDGGVMALATTVEGDELVAMTPGFCTFMAGQPSDIGGERRVSLRIDGASFLPVGRELPYTARDFFVSDPSRLGYFWQSWGGGAVLTNASAASAVIRGASTEAGVTVISVEVVDAKDGLRMFASFNVTVIEAGSPSIELLASKLSVEPGELVGFDASISGGTPPYTLSWQDGDGDSGGAVAEATTLAPSDGSARPPLLFTNVPNHGWSDLGFFTATIDVVDADGASARHAVAIEIHPGALTLSLSGRQTLEITGAGISEERYQLRIEGAPPFSVRWSGSGGVLTEVDRNGRSGVAQGGPGG